MNGALHVAGPPGHPVLGHFIPFRDHTLDFFEGAARDYGDLVRLRFGPQTALLVNSPSLVEQVFHDQARFAKGGVWKRLEPLLGLGLLTSDGDTWRRQRRLLVPAFHRARLARLAEQMVSIAQETVERWRRDHGQGQELNIHGEMMALALEVAVRSLFSASVREDTQAIARAFTEVQSHLLRRLWSFNPWTGRLPTPRNQRFERALAVLDEVVLRIISEHRRGQHDHGDLLSMMLQVVDEETGQGMTDQQIRDEVMTIILAGHETTANALSWTWVLLDQHPEVRAALDQEHARVLGGARPGFEHLPELALTDQVVREAMRLYPPIWLIARTTTEAVTLGGFDLPASTLLMISPYLLHRHDAWWEQPERFDPSRFTPEADKARPRYAYMPFGAGPRTCLGQRFAMMEASLVLATLCQHFQVHITTPAVEPLPLLALRPRRARAALTLR